MIITKKHSKSFFIAVAFLLLAWLILTLWIEQEGSKRNLELGATVNGKIVLVVYDPDPFYNFDQQLCEAFALTLVDQGWKVVVSTVSAAKELKNSQYNLYVLCANTYNWSPDWAIANYIKTTAPIEQRKVVAITVGAGSTGRSQREFETLIRSKGAILIDSRSFWLWRPNDEALLQESNVILALNLVQDWAEEIAIRISKDDNH